MAIAQEVIDLISELLEPMGGVTTRRMFGGLGVFRHGLSFALYSSQGEFALKVDDQTIDEFKAYGFKLWVPPMKNRKPVNMGYWVAPEHLLEDQDELLHWANLAFEAAVRLDQKKPLKQQKLKLNG